MDPGLPRTSTSKDSDSSPIANKPNAKINFLFVNETSQSTEYKVGHRPTIRSHVRRHAARHFKQKHKTAGRIEATDSGSNRLLVPQAADQDSSQDLIHDPDSPEPNCGEESGLYCKACKKRLDKRAGTIALNRQRLTKQSKLSPLEILGSGRSDPFLVYPVENPSESLHELMDLVVTYFVPRLCPDDAPPPGVSSGANIVSKAWFTAGLKNPLLFHALAFAGLIHMDFLRYNQIYPNSIRALPQKLIVIQKLNEAIANGSEMSTDDVMLAILVLASHDTLKVTEEKRRPFSSPLRRAQWINVYGHIKYIPEHIKAVLDLLNLRGGLETLQMPGLAETIVGGDIMSAINTFSHPILPLLRSHENYIAAVKVWAMTQHDTLTSSQLLSSAFWRVQHHGITDSLLHVLDAMGALTLAINHYMLRTPGSLTLGQVARTRTAVQKRVLLLPKTSELHTTAKLAETETGISIYECCRLAAMIFNVAVIAPIPYTYDVLQMYVTHLRTAIEVSGLLVPQMHASSPASQNQHSDLDKFLLWVLVLGGIASLDKPERGWFVEQLKIVKEVLEVDWFEVKDILGTFLWLESACGDSGEELWVEVKRLK